VVPDDRSHALIHPPRYAAGVPPVLQTARRQRLLAAWVLFVLAIAGCSTPFDPTGPCTADGFAAGAYPELEALVPATFQGRGPDRLDSGRNCTEERLGTLWGIGIRELRFAGGLWELGAESGSTLAVFNGQGLSVDAMADFYEAGARAAPDTRGLERATVSVGSATGQRLDLDNDGYLQTVVVWPAIGDGTIRVVLVSSAARDVVDKAAHDATVLEALGAFD
jgi:hypothetical protein